MRKSLLRIFGPSFFAAITVSAFSGAAVAACYSPDKAMSPQAVSDFKNNPAALLSSPDLTETVRKLVASDPSTLPAVINLLKTADNAQQSAIGTGLGEASNDCNIPDPTFGTNIGLQVAQSGSTLASTQWAAITGKPTASVAGGGGGGVSGGGVGNGTNPTQVGFGSTGSGTVFSSQSTATSGQSYFSGGTSGISAAVTTSTPASNSVSK